MQMDQWCDGLSLLDRAAEMIAREGYAVVAVDMGARKSGFTGFVSRACPAVFRAAGVPAFVMDMKRLQHRSLLAALRAGVEAGIFSASGHAEAERILEAHDTWD